MNMVGMLYGLLCDKLRRRTLLILAAAMLIFWPIFGLLALPAVPLAIQIWALPLCFILVLYYLSYFVIFSSPLLVVHSVT